MVRCYRSGDANGLTTEHTALFWMASRRGDGGGEQSLHHHPNAPFQLRRDSILALQTLRRGLQVPSLHHGEVRVVAGLGFRLEQLLKFKLSHTAKTLLAALV
jgi:hypothetical protein